MGSSSVTITLRPTVMSLCACAARGTPSTPAKAAIASNLFRIVISFESAQGYAQARPAEHGYAPGRRIVPEFADFPGFELLHCA
jgi:hypothetical protein